MEHNSRARSLQLALGMTLALFAVQTALMGSSLSHISGAGQALALSALCSVLALAVASTSSPLYATNFWTDNNLYFTH